MTKKPRSRGPATVWRPTAIVYEGRVLPMYAYTRITGVSVKMLDHRINELGWSDHDAIYTATTMCRPWPTEGEDDKSI